MLPLKSKDEKEKEQEWRVEAGTGNVRRGCGCECEENNVLSWHIDTKRTEDSMEYKKHVTQ